MKIKRFRNINDNLTYGDFNNSIDEFDAEIEHYDNQIQQLMEELDDKIKDLCEIINEKIDLDELQKRMGTNITFDDLYINDPTSETVKKVCKIDCKNNILYFTDSTEHVLDGLVIINDLFRILEILDTIKIYSYNYQNFLIKKKLYTELEEIKKNDMIHLKIAKKYPHILSGTDLNLLQ